MPLFPSIENSSDHNHTSVFCRLQSIIFQDLCKSFIRCLSAGPSRFSLVSPDSGCLHHRRSFSCGIFSSFPDHFYSKAPGSFFPEPLLLFLKLPAPLHRHRSCHRQFIALADLPPLTQHAAPALFHPGKGHSHISLRNHLEFVHR